jgi:hypothetical protein
MRRVALLNDVGCVWTSLPKTTQDGVNKQGPLHEDPSEPDNVVDSTRGSVTRGFVHDTMRWLLKDQRDDVLQDRDLFTIGACCGCEGKDVIPDERAMCPEGQEVARPDHAFKALTCAESEQCHRFVEDPCEDSQFEFSLALAQTERCGVSTKGGKKGSKKKTTGKKNGKQDGKKEGRRGRKG